MLSDIKYYPKQNRYRVTEGAGKGQFISKTAFLSQVQVGIERETEKFSNLVESLYSNQIDVKTFEQEICLGLRRLHVGQAVLGAEGYENMRSQDWLDVARDLKKEYYAGIGVNGKRYGIRYLINDFEQGKLSEAQLKWRLGLFAKNSRKSFFKQEERRNEAKPFAIRTLGIAEHCPECIEYASLGIVPKALLPNVGERCSCGANCKCTKKYLEKSK